MPVGLCSCTFVFDAEKDTFADTANSGTGNIIIDSPDVGYQGESSKKLKFCFEFFKELGATYSEGEKIEIASNIDTLFLGYWEKPSIISG